MFWLWCLWFICFFMFLYDDANVPNRWQTPCIQRMYIGKINKNYRTKQAQFFHSSNHPKWLPYQILGGKTVINVQIDPQTTEIWPKELFVTLFVRGRMSNTLVRKKLSFYKKPMVILAFFASILLSLVLQIINRPTYVALNDV